MRFAEGVAVAIFGALGITGARAGAQPVPLDATEFQVNSFTADLQFPTSIARWPDGSFIVVWTSEGSFGTDSSGQSVQARLFNADGRALGAQFQVNGYTTGDQGGGAVAAQPGGGFVIAWESYGSFGNDDDRSSIQARRFRADGAPLDPAEFQVNTYTLDTQWNPSVASDAQGAFVVAWDSYGSFGTDSSYTSVQARRFGAGGNALEPAEFQVNAYTTYDQRRAAVGQAPRGDFIVTWTSDGSFGSDNSYESIQARRFALDGSPLDPVEAQVNVFTGYRQYGSSVAVSPDGDFVVTWSSYFGFGNDDFISVQARRFAADGTARDPVEFQVNAYTTSGQAGPDVAIDASGAFVVAWTSVGSYSPEDPNTGSVQARRFRADGSPVDAQELQVNSYTTESQQSPHIAVLPEGEFVVTWSSFGSFENDQDTSVQARRFGRPSIPVTSLSGGSGGPGCTLRDAVAAASTDSAVGECPAGSGGGVVELPAGATVALTETDNGANALPVVERSVTIRGEGARIERDPGLACPVGPEFRLLEVVDGGVLTLEDVAVSNGCLSSDPGGGVLVGGGTLVLRKASIEGNESGGDGGGVAVLGGNLIALDSTVRGNLAGGGGGGISVSGAPDLLLVSGSTLSENEAGAGGGLLLASPTPLLVRNSTFSGNVAQASGGGIEVDDAGAELGLDFVTVTDNSAAVGAGAHVGDGELSLHGSLVGENAGGADCAAGAGSVAASGMNLDTDASCAALAGGNVATVGVLELAPLGDYGGPTRTHAPLEGSPVLDAAPACVTRSRAAIAADQRGHRRPTDDDGDLVPECDLGAVERGLIFADGFASGDTSSWSLTVP